MEKLKLEEIVGYLPYELKYYNEYSYKKGIEHTLIELDTYGFLELTNYEAPALLTDIHIKPILRPLSDLKNKDLDYWIEFSQAIDEMNTEYLIDALVNGTFYSRDIHFSFKLLQVLYSMHFDIHNLIERGLAIDINTLEKWKN
jgi:hypothetical protein